MNVRELPPLQPLCDRHKHVVLLWDNASKEGPAGGGRQTLPPSFPTRGAGTAGTPLWKRRNVERLRPLGGWDTTCTRALTSPNRTNACLPPLPILEVGRSCWWEPEVVMEWATGSTAPRLTTERGCDGPRVMQCLTSPRAENNRGSGRESTRSSLAGARRPTRRSSASS